MSFLVDSQKIKPIVIGFLFGAILFCTMSVIQKNIADYNPLLLKAYIIPFIFGGCSGSALGYYFYKVKLLNEAVLQRVNKLESVLPICSNCKKIRTPGSNPKDNGSWEIIESYISERTTSQFSHSICPDCIENIYGKDFL